MHDWLKTALDSTNTRQNTKCGLGDQSAAKVIKGDHATAQRYLPIAQQLLGALANQMQLSGVHYGIRTVTLPDGAMIQVLRNQTLSTIRIALPGSSLPTTEIDIVIGGFIGIPSDVITSWEAVFIRTVFNWALLQLRPETSANSTLNAGSVSWFGRLIYNNNGDYHHVALSWDHGLPCRYRLAPSEGLECGGRFLRMDDAGIPTFANSGYPYLYFQGRTIPTAHNVVGAAIIGDRLVYVSYIDLTWVDNPSDDADTNAINRANNNAKHATFFLSTPFRLGSGAGALTWTDMGVVEAETSTFKAPWFFSPTGTKASTILEGYTGQFYLHNVTLFVGNGGDSSGLIDDSEEVNWEPRRAVIAYEPDTTVAASGGEYSYGPWVVHAWAYQIMMPLAEMVPFVYEKAQEIVDSELSRCPSKDPPPSLDATDIEGVIRRYETDTIALTDAMLPAFPWQPIGAVGYLFGVPVGGQTISDLSRSMSGVVNNQCFSIEGVKGFFGFYAQRDTTAEESATRTTKVYQSEFYGDRYVAIDYGFDGEKLTVTQKLKNNLPKFTYTKTNSRNFFNGFTGIRDYPFGTNGPYSESGTMTDYLNEFEIGTEWEFSVNDEPLVTAFGGIDTDEHLVSRRFTVRIIGGSPEYLYEDNGPQPILSERVWLLDADARTLSAVYNKMVATATTEPIADAVVDDGTWRANAMYALSVVGLQDHAKENYIAVVHHGEEVARTVVPTQNPYALYDLRNRGAPLHLLPRMFSFNDEQENVFPDAIVWDEDVFWYDPATWRAWLTTPRDCFPTQRELGSLAVRTDRYSIASVSDLSLIGEVGDGYGCGNSGRVSTNINMAMFDDVSYALQPELLSALNRAAEAADEDPVVFADGFNFRPVKVI